MKQNFDIILLKLITKIFILISQIIQETVNNGREEEEKGVVEGGGVGSTVKMRAKYTVNIFLNIQQEVPTYRRKRQVINIFTNCKILSRFKNRKLYKLLGFLQCTARQIQASGHWKPPRHRDRKRDREKERKKGSEYIFKYFQSIRHVFIIHKK